MKEKPRPRRDPNVEVVRDPEPQAEEELLEVLFEILDPIVNSRQESTR